MIIINHNGLFNVTVKFFLLSKIIARLKVSSSNSSSCFCCRRLWCIMLPAHYWCCLCPKTLKNVFEMTITIIIILSCFSHGGENAHTLCIITSLQLKNNYRLLYKHLRAHEFDNSCT